MNAYREPNAGGLKKDGASPSPAPTSHLQRFLVEHAERNGKVSLRFLNKPIAVTDPELVERLNAKAWEAKDRGNRIEMKLDGEWFHGLYTPFSYDWHYGKAPAVVDGPDLQKMLDQIEDEGGNPRKLDKYDLTLSRARRFNVHERDEYDEASERIKVRIWDLNDMKLKWGIEERMQPPENLNEHEEYIGKDAFDRMLVTIRRLNPESEGPAGVSAH